MSRRRCATPWRDDSLPPVVSIREGQQNGMGLVSNTKKSSPTLLVCCFKVCRVELEQRPVVFVLRGLYRRYDVRRSTSMFLPPRAQKQQQQGPFLKTLWRPAESSGR